MADNDALVRALMIANSGSQEAPSLADVLRRYQSPTTTAVGTPQPIDRNAMNVGPLSPQNKMWLDVLGTIPKDPINDEGRRLALGLMGGVRSPMSKLDAQGRALMPGTIIGDAERPVAGQPYTLYHGALEEYAPDPSTFRWFATNKGHASHFGDVTEHRATFSNPAYMDADKFDVPVGRHGDEWLYEHANNLFAKGHDALFIRNWEGPQWSVLTRDDIGRYEPSTK